MIPLALVGNFSLNKHIAAIAAYDEHDHLAEVFKLGIQDWFRARDVTTCLEELSEWPLWLQEYKQALMVSSEFFKKKPPAQIAFGVFQERHYIVHPQSQTFVVNKPERLQVALLHIEHLPQTSPHYAHELDVWATASPGMREAASSDIGQWYNLFQDDNLLRWHLQKKGNAIAPESYALPHHMIPEN
jgi:hypothetical protein